MSLNMSRKLKELAINTEKCLKNITASNISKNVALYMLLRYFKNKSFLEHLIMIIYGNVTKYAEFQQYEQYIWYIGI